MTRFADLLSVPLGLLVCLVAPCGGSTFTLLLSLPNNSQAFSVGHVGAGALIAIHRVNSHPGLLPGHWLDYEYVDDECSDLRGPGKIVELQRQRKYSAFIGPSCSEAYPTLTRVFEPFTKMGSFFMEICKKFGWRRIGIAHDSRRAWKILADGIRFQAEKNNITVANFLEFDSPTNQNASQIYSRILAEMAKVSRIIVISARGNDVRGLLVEAHRKGLTSGDYVFFCFEPYKQLEMFGNFDWEQGNEDDGIAKQAYQALFPLALYTPSNEDYHAFSRNVIRRSREDFGYTYAENEKEMALAAVAHDAVWLYAQALNETLAEGGDPYDGRTITRRMWNRTVTGIQGDVTMDDNGDRESAYMMKHVQGSDGKFKVIANYFGTSKMYEPETPINWPGGRTTPPRDTPECGFSGELCFSIERRVTLVLGLIVGLMAAGIFAVIVLYRKHTLREKEATMLWKINPSDVIMMEQGSMTSAVKSASFRSNSIQASLESILCSMHDKPSAHRTAVYQGTACFVRFVNERSLCVSAELLTELKQCRELTHPNVCNFIGACLDPPQSFILTEYCPKGSLQDILKNSSIKLDWGFKYSLLLDLLKGMVYLHHSALRSHGHLSSSNCVVDGRFVLKVSDCGLTDLRWTEPEESANSLLWRAPELLRQARTGRGTQKGDVYSFGIIAQEVVYRRGPFYIPNCTLNAREIVEWVRAEGVCVVLRPHTDRLECPEGVEALLQACWRERPAARPDFPCVKAMLRRLCPKGGGDNILDDLLSRLEQYASSLEEVVSERTGQLQEEKKRAEGLLTQMLPRSVAGQLIAGRTVEAETYDCVTIYFSDIEGFTAMSASLTPMQVVNVLNDLYTYFDNIIDNHDVYKVETIGDAYMVVSGLPIRNGDLHAREIAHMSLAIVRGMKHYQNRHVPHRQLKVRIGLHSGPCVAGVVGLKMPRYCLFGDTVNTASRMESYGLPLRIHLSSSTKTLLDTVSGFQCELRGDIHVKGKGLVRTFWLLGEDP